MTDDNMTSIWVACAAFLLLSIQTAHYLKTRNYIVFFIWPAFIYLIGPTATLIFSDAPVLGRYVDDSRVTVQTLLMVWYLLCLAVADKLFNLSSALRRAIDGQALKNLSSSRIFKIVFISVVVVASTLQIVTLRNFGTIFNGTYLLDSTEELPYWGFIAGLYEVIFSCFVMFLLGKRQSRGLSWLYVGLYAFTTVLRILGGTRLVLLKEFAFMILYFYLRGAISGKRLLLIGGIVIAIGSGVGLMRSSGGSEGTAMLGPLYGLVMESALNALTLGIADSVNHSGAVAQSASIFTTIGYLALSVVPSFLRFGLTEEGLTAMSPYGLALTSGFDTSTPVGGMSGFATIDYLTSYPFVFLLGMVLAFAASFTSLRNTPFRQFLGLVVLTNSIHFWRDPADIAFKLLVQGLVVCALFHVTPPLRNRLRKRPRQAPIDPATAARFQQRLT